MENKFKVGDKVRVVDRICGHGFHIGDIITIVKVNSEDYRCERSESEYWYLTDEEITLVAEAAEGENNELCIHYANDFPEDYELVEGHVKVAEGSKELVDKALGIVRHNHYFKDFPYEKIDVYRLLSVFEVTDPCLQHLVKKGLCAGKRGHKDFRKDLQDIIDTAQRRIDMLDEDEKIND